MWTVASVALLALVKDVNSGNSALSVNWCRRRLVKRIYIPMPDAEGRRSLLKHTLEEQPVKLTATELERLVQVIFWL